MAHDREKHEKLKGVFLAAFEREEAEDFRFLGALPTSNVARFIGVYRSLTPAERAVVKRGIASIRAGWFGFPVEAGVQEDREAFVQRVGLSEPPRGQLVPGLTDVSNVQLKRLAALAMKQLLGAKPERTDEPGERAYTGQCGGEAVTVRLRHPMRLYQLEYSVRVPSLARQGFPGDRGVHYETLLGFTGGAWNQITAANVDKSFAMLKEAVVRVVEIGREVEAVLSP